MVRPACLVGISDTMVSVIFRLFVLAFLFGLSSCSDLTFEYPELTAEEIEITEFRVVSYNIHGGKGQNNEGNLRDNLLAFKSMLQGESILCFQEVVPDCWSDVKSIFPEYPYRYFLPQVSTKFGTNKKGGNAILSKLPIQTFDQKLIQCDPGGDKWERRAQYIRIHIGYENQYLNLFHYHNTYNWHEDNSAFEKSGMMKFREYVNSKAISEEEITVILGDFNLSKNQVEDIISVEFYSNSYSNWVDHLYTNVRLLYSGFYDTRGNRLSDHQTIWSVVCNNDC